MNRVKRTFTRIVLMLAVSVAMSAQAQVDDFLQRYDLAIENLGVAVGSVPDDTAKATEELDQAVTALLSLSRESTSPTLVSSMERLLERARTAVQNRSKADVGVQAAVLAGGFRRLVYESAFRRAVAGDLDTARARLDHIAQDMGMPQAARDSLTAAADPGALRLRFEAGVAQGIQQHLATVRALGGADRAGAYQALAEAYGASLIVQDSPRLTTPMDDDFVAAATALVAGDDAALAGATQRLEATAQVVEQSSTAALTDPAPAAAAPAGDGAASADLPALSPVDAATAPAAPGASLPADPTAPADAPTAAAGAADAAEPSAEPGAAALDLARLRTELAAELEAERQTARREALRSEVTAAGLAGAAVERLVDALLAADLTDLDAAVQQLYADAGRATAAVLAGDLTTARQQLARTAADYRATLAPLIARKSAATDRAMREVLTRSVDVVGLRMQDVDALTAQVDAVARVVAGQAAPSNHALNAGTLSFWAGWPRLIVMLMFGILAFVPLYLLNLAFGGGNRNWQLIGFALLLLLLPVVYEALAAIGSLVAYLTREDAFELLATYSMFQSPVGQVAWALLTVAAILLAIWGLYGICVQFGLLGRRRGGAASGPSATQTNTATMTSTGSQEAAEALVDWDEEF